MAKLLCNEISQVNISRKKVQNEKANTMSKIEEIEKDLQERIQNIEMKFQELLFTLNEKEKEAKNALRKAFETRKDLLKQEIEVFENANLKTDTLIDVVEFAMCYPASYFCEGKKN